MKKKVTKRIFHFPDQSIRVGFRNREHFEVFYTIGIPIYQDGIFARNIDFGSYYFTVKNFQKYYQNYAHDLLDGPFRLLSSDTI